MEIITVEVRKEAGIVDITAMAGDEILDLAMSLTVAQAAFSTQQEDKIIASLLANPLYQITRKGTTILSAKKVKKGMYKFIQQNIRTSKVHNKFSRPSKI